MYTNEMRGKTVKIREKKIKSLKAVIGLGLVSAVVMAGMFPISAALGTDYSRQTITMAQAAGKYKTQGRTGAVGTGLTMDWSGSGIEFNADCEGDVYLNMKVQSSWKHAYITAVVDGKRMPRIEAKTNSTGLKLHPVWQRESILLAFIMKRNVPSLS